MTPKISVKPSARSAYDEPMRMPSMLFWMTSTIVRRLAGGPAAAEIGAVDDLVLGELAGVPLNVTRPCSMR